MEIVWGFSGSRMDFDFQKWLYVPQWTENNYYQLLFNN